MICIRVRAIAYNLCIDMSTTLLSMLQSLQNNNTGALAHNKSAAVGVKWTGSMSWIIIVVHAQSLHSTEACYSSRRNTCFSTACQHYICITTLQYTESITNIIGTSSTGSYNTAAWPLQAKGNGYMASSHIANHHRNEEWADTGRSLVKQLLILAMHGLNAANTAAYESTDSFQIFLLQIQLGILNSQLSCCHSKLSITINTLGFLLVHIIGWVKILNLAGNLCLVLCCIEAGNFINTIFSGHHGIPECLFADTYRAYNAQTGNNNAIRQK